MQQPEAKTPDIMTPEIKDYDLIVVGGSFAGLTCARAAAWRGLKVALIDRKEGPAVNIRTTGILVKEAAEALDFPAYLARRVPHVRIYDSKNQHTDLKSPGYFFMTTETGGVLTHLAEEAARAGVDCHWGKSFTTVELVPGGGYYLRALGLRCRYLVGADGARSAVARLLGLSRNQKFIYGAELELPLPQSLDPDFLHCFVDRGLAPGYIAWAVAGPREMQLGLASYRQKSLPLMAFKARVENMLQVEELPILGRRSGPLPCGGHLRRTHTSRALLIGDAAGWVSPLTGGGVEPSLRLGRKAGIAISDYLSGTGVEPARALAPHLPSYGVKRVLRQLANVAPGGWLLDAALATPPMKAFARQIYFHKRGCADEMLHPGPLDQAAQRQETAYEAARS